MAKTDNNAQKFTNFEEMFSKTKNVAETINKKSAMYLELSRKRIEYMDAKSKLAKAYEKFGRLQYETYLGNDVDENDYACAVADISALKEKTQSLEAELEEAKTKMPRSLKEAPRSLKMKLSPPQRRRAMLFFSRQKIFQGCSALRKGGCVL